MQAPHNALKAALAAGRVQRGVWLNLGGAITAEIAGHAGFDWALIDGEHGPWDPVGIREQLIALEGTGTSAVLRLPAAEAWIAKQALDLGAQTLMVPMIETADAAREMVAACRYPPEGVRGLGAAVARSGGYGRLGAYTRTANDEICLIVQVESRAALRNLDAICAVDGVDCVFVGPADLGADMGFRDALDHPDLWAEIFAALAQIAASGKPSGIIMFDPASVRDMVMRGVGFVGVGSDAMLLNSALHAAARP